MTPVTACSVGAAHARRRLFVVAYPHRDGESVLGNAVVPQLAELVGRAIMTDASRRSERAA